MTTRLFSTVVDHTSNAGFQAWATELYNELIAAGLTQTADTGQLATPVVAARPGTNTAAGYWIFRFNDTHQGTSPIFIKLEPGTGAGAAAPSIFATVGTGTNGSGTITGSTILPRVNILGTNSWGTTTTAFPSGICVTDGNFGLAWKAGAQGASSYGGGLLIVGRTVDANGAPTADGVSVLNQNNGPSSMARSFDFGSSTVVGPTTNAFCLVHYGITNTAYGADFQVFKHYGVFGRVQSLVHLVTVVRDEIPDFTTFSCAVVGTAPRTYINVAQCGYQAFGLGGVAGTHRVAMLWE